MITYKCCLCHTEQETPILVKDLARGQKTTCIKCGVDLALVLVVTTREMLKAKLGKKNGENT